MPFGKSAYFNTEKKPSIVVGVAAMDEDQISFGIHKNQFISAKDDLVKSSQDNLVAPATDNQKEQATLSEAQAQKAINRELDKLIKLKVIDKLDVSNYSIKSNGLYIASFGSAEVMQTHYWFTLTDNDKTIDIQINSDNGKIMYIGSEMIKFSDCKKSASIYADYLHHKDKGNYWSFVGKDYEAYYQTNGMTIDDSAFCGFREGYYVVCRACGDFMDLGSSTQD